ncbi:MAG: hypothetical protein OEW67_00915 [Cyclobacteriaceae bacterium]|nr:hypothetical protein [Cyclobacteriaceae bacterium]
MKKLFNLLALGTVLSLISIDANAQCNADTYTNTCIPKLSSGFNFLKSYKIDGAGGGKSKVEYSYVFTKGTQYMINICAEGETTDGIVVTLYDSKRQKVGTSVYNGQYLTAMAYPCNTTGIYYITYTFENSANYCGGSALGFKR